MRRVRGSARTLVLAALGSLSCAAVKAWPRVLIALGPTSFRRPASGVWQEIQRGQQPVERSRICGVRRNLSRAALKQTKHQIKKNTWDVCKGSILLKKSVNRAQ